MSRRDRVDTAFTLAFYIGLTVLGVVLFSVLVDRPAVAAAWALLATGGMGWVGCLYAARVNTDRLRALDAEHTPPAVADLLVLRSPGKRIGDTERDVIVGALHTHFAAGRLDRAELDERLTGALKAKTVTELATAVDGLPDERTGR